MSSLKAIDAANLGGETIDGEGLGTSVLLFAAQPFASMAASALYRAGTIPVTVVATQAACLEALRRETFDVFLLEQSTTALDRRTAQVLYEAAGTAVVLEVNFGLMGAERIALSLLSAMRRRRYDLLCAQTEAKAILQRELTASLTGLLLEAQLALHQAGPRQAPALARLVELAEHVCAQLRADDVRSPEQRSAHLHHR